MISPCTPADTQIYDSFPEITSVSFPAPTLASLFLTGKTENYALCHQRTKKRDFTTDLFYYRIFCQFSDGFWETLTVMQSILLETQQTTRLLVASREKLSTK